jgi:hypothetical protein
MTDCNGKTITYGYDRMGNRVSIGYRAARWYAILIIRAGA